MWNSIFPWLKLSGLSLELLLSESQRSYSVIAALIAWLLEEKPSQRQSTCHRVQLRMCMADVRNAVMDKKSKQGQKNSKQIQGTAILDGAPRSSIVTP